jgi:hypothetical protein
MKAYKRALGLINNEVITIRSGMLHLILNFFILHFPFPVLPPPPEIFHNIKSQRRLYSNTSQDYILGRKPDILN